MSGFLRHLQSIFKLLSASEAVLTLVKHVLDRAHLLVHVAVQHVSLLVVSLDGIISSDGSSTGGRAAFLAFSSDFADVAFSINSYMGSKAKYYVPVSRNVSSECAPSSLSSEGQTG